MRGSSRGRASVPSSPTTSPACSRPSTTPTWISDRSPLLHLDVELGEIRLRSRSGRGVRGDARAREPVVAGAGRIAVEAPPVGALQVPLGDGGPEQGRVWKGGVHSVVSGW